MNHHVILAVYHGTTKRIEGYRVHKLLGSGCLWLTHYDDEWVWSRRYFFTFDTEEQARVAFTQAVLTDAKTI